MKGICSNFLSLKNISYFVQRSGIDLFEENSTGNLDTKIYSGDSIKFVLKYVYSMKLFLMSIYLHKVPLDPRLNACNADIF